MQIITGNRFQIKPDGLTVRDMILKKDYFYTTETEAKMMCRYFNKRCKDLVYSQGKNFIQTHNKGVPEIHKRKVLVRQRQQIVSYNPNSTVGQVVQALKDGHKTSPIIAYITGINNDNVSGYLLYLLKRGVVTRTQFGRMYVYDIKEGV